MKYNNENIIKSYSYSQDEILYNILQLYNNGEDFEVDPTFSKGGFYNKSKEYPLNPPKYKFDVKPLIDGVIKIEPLGRLPLDDNSVKSIVVDLPFICSPNVPDKFLEENKTACIIFRRFAGYYPIKELFISYYHFLEECFRILQNNGICVWKTQRTVSGRRMHMIPEMSWKFAEEIGFYTIDRFTLIKKNRIIGRIKTQEHSRSYDSQFYVFVKPDGGSKTKPINYIHL